MSEKAAAALLEAAHHADIYLTGTLKRREEVPKEIIETFFEKDTSSHFIHFPTEGNKTAYLPIHVDSDIRRAPQFEKLEGSEVTVSGALERTGNSYSVYPGTIEPSAGPLHCISISGILATKRTLSDDETLFVVHIPNTNAGFEVDAYTAIPCRAKGEHAHAIRDTKHGEPVSLLGETSGFGPIAVKELN